MRSLTPYQHTVLKVVREDTRTCRWLEVHGKDYRLCIDTSEGDALSIHVVTLPVVAPPEVNVDPKPLEQAGLRILEDAKNIAKKEGVDPKTTLGKAYGNPAQEILRIAEQEGFDLIVIGAKGHSLLDKLLVGSVCETVMHHAACPVLVVHHK